MSPDPGRLRDGTKYVIGCVSGAHYELTARCEAAGIEAPDYDWCERRWKCGLLREAADVLRTKAMPGWLTDRLEPLWLEQLAGPTTEQQLELFAEVSR